MADCAEKHFFDVNLSINHIIIYSIIFVISFYIVICSILSLYRANYVYKKSLPKQLSYARRLLPWQGILQIICFGGYWINSFYVYQICWSIFIPLGSLSIMFICLKVSQSYHGMLLTKNLNVWNSYQNRLKKQEIIFYIAWLVTSIINVIGTLIFLFDCNFQVVSHICDAIWQTFGIIWLLIIMAIVMKIKKGIQIVLTNFERNYSTKSSGNSSNNNTTDIGDDTNNVSPKNKIIMDLENKLKNETSLTKKISKLQESIKSMNVIAWSLLVLLIILTENFLFNINYILNYFGLYEIPDILAPDYTGDQIFIVAVVLFPIWLCINMFTLLATFVYKKDLKRNKKKKKQANIRKLNHQKYMNQHKYKDKTQKFLPKHPKRDDTNPSTKQKSLNTSSVQNTIKTTSDDRTYVITSFRGNTHPYNEITIENTDM
mmetsp:Transcript_79332/g.97022  ORF Transcript_79332/g.97022 Transcript_79332/m.97022 type:complete len:430 (-) Transcript_79332:48-1337(-)